MGCGQSVGLKLACDLMRHLPPCHVNVERRGARRDVTVAPTLCVAVVSAFARRTGADADAGREVSASASVAATPALMVAVASTAAITMRALACVPHRRKRDAPVGGVWAPAVAASGGRVRVRGDMRLPYLYDRSMTIMELDYGIPSEDDLARLVGAATPHFALQIRDRVVAYRAALPEGHPRAAELDAQIARLERLAIDGAGGPTDEADLPPRPSLELRGRDRA